MSEISESIRKYIIDECKAHLVGYAPASALDDEPEGHRATDILPGAKSIIIYAKRISDGAIQAAFRRREDSNWDAESIYATYGSDILPNMGLFFTEYNLAQYIEQTYAFPTVPIPCGPCQNTASVNKKYPLFIGPAVRDYIINIKKAAVAAGLGELGWNNRLITPEFGPRVQVAALLTQLELDYSEPYSGKKLCDPEKCGYICAHKCPTNALSLTESVLTCICGTTQVEGCFKDTSCAVASLGFRKEFTGKAWVPDQIMTNDPSEEELEEAYLTKPFIHWSIDHYPKHYCNNCLLYCPAGKWKEHFSDKGLSDFKPKVSK